jgi:hypothetical protein
MANIRQQIKEARKEGYSDDEIASFLSQADPRISEALSEGYNLDQISNYVQPPTFREAMSPEITKPEFLDAAGRTIGRALRSTVQGVSAPANLVLDPIYQMAGQEPASVQQSRAMTELGLPEYPPTFAGRIAEAGTEALAGAGSQIGLAAQLAQKAAAPITRAISERFASQPAAQIAATPPSAIASQSALELTGSPVAALAAGVAGGAAAGVRPRPGAQATKEQIRESIDTAYKEVNQSNILIRTDAFNKQMSSITQDLRSKGYSPTNKRFEGITAMIDDIRTNTEPKDIVELKTIREQITMSADPRDKDAYRLMRIIRDRFDNYLLNLPEDQIMAGNKKDMASWKEARRLFQRDKKAEVFEDILANAPVAKGQFSQSGMENYMYNELKKLAKNKTKMAQFTKDEQEQIRKAASGSGLQNALKFIGRFAPTGPVPLISTLGVGAFDTGLASGVAATSLAARYGAEKIRLGEVERLINMMRSGQGQPTMFQNVPVTAARGLLSSQYGME